MTRYALDGHENVLAKAESEFCIIYLLITAGDPPH